METPKRLTPTKETLRKLFAFSGNQCAYPGCDHPLLDEEDNFVAQVCHIEAAATDGERFNENQTNEERRHFDNLLILCYRHHVKTNNVDKYPVEKMVRMKKDHEDRFLPDYNRYTQVHVDSAYSLLKDIQVVVEKTQQTTNRIEGNSETIISMLNEALKNTSSLNTDEIGQEIEYAKELRKEGKYLTAIEFLDKIVATKWEKLTQPERFKIFSLLGLSHLESGSHEQAASYFVRAFHFDKNKSAYNLGITGYLIQKKFDTVQKLIDEGLALFPNHSGIYASIVRISGIRDKSIDEILNKIPKEFHNDSEIALEIASVLHNRGQYRDAIYWSQIGLENASSQLYIFKSRLASSMLASIVSPYKIVTKQISQQEINVANTVIHLFSEAWNEVKETELRKSQFWMLTNRGIAKKIIGNYDEAFQDIATSNEINQDFWNLRHLAVVAFECNKMDLADRCLLELEAIALPKEKTDILLLKADFLKLDKRYGESIATLKDLLENDVSVNDELIAKSILAENYIRVGENIEALKISEELINKYPHKSHLYIYKAKIFESEQDFTNQKKTLLEAYVKHTDNTEPIETQQLADELLKLGLYPETTVLLEKSTDLKIYSDQSKKLIHAYFLAKQYHKALSACKYLMKTYGQIGFLVEIICLIYDKSNDINEAIKVCEDYLSVNPDDQYITIRLLLLYERTNNSDKAQNLLQQFLTHVDHTLSYAHKYLIAECLSRYNYKERAFEIAYEARRQDFDNPHVHNDFISLYTNINRDDDLEHIIDTVSIDTAVTISIDKRDVIYVIENRSDTKLSKNELAHDSPLGVSLIGKKAGSELVYNSNGTEHQIVIKSINHKVNYAFHESLNLLGSTFLTESKIKSYNIGKTGKLDQDFEQLFEIIHRQAARDLKIDHFYKEYQATIGLVSELKKTNEIKVWSNYIGDGTGILTVSNQQELLESIRLLPIGKGFVFDAISTYSAFVLDLTQQLNNLPRKVISQSTIDIYLEILNELELTKKNGSLQLGSMNGKIFRQYLSPEEIATQINKLKECINWISSSFEVLPCNYAINRNDAELNQMYSTLGKNSSEAILIAKENNYVLYTEEVLLRNIALEKENVKATSSYAFIHYLYQNRFCDIEKYKKTVKLLITLNYHLIPVEHFIIYEIANESKFELNHKLSKCIEGLISPLLPIEKSIEYTVRLILLIFKEKPKTIIPPNYEELLNQILIKILGVLEKRYKAQPINKLLNSMLTDLLSDNKPLQNHLIQRINQYFKS